MQNDSLKIQALKTAMNNPRMAKLIMDAVKAPVGSSKREQAKSVIVSLHVAQKNKQQKSMMPVLILDPKGGKGGGQGGPIQTFMTPPSPPTPEYISLKPINVAYYKFTAPVQPAPEPMSVKPPMGQGGGLPLNTGYQNINKALGLDFSQPEPQTQSQPAPQVQSPTLPNWAKPSTWWNGLKTGAQKLTGLVGPSNQSILGAYAEQKGTFKDPVNPPNPPSQPVVPVAQAQTSSQSPVTVVPPQTTAPLSTVGAPPNTGTPGSSGSALGDYILGKYQQGAGPLETYLGVANDSKKLQELFPGVPLSQIPVGASLAGQLNDLQDSLKKEFRINELGDALSSAVNRGATLQDDVTAYIRGKDEFLNSVDKMLKGATDSYINSSSHGDPFYEKSMQQYTNYLSTLKGRATQNYIDYLNTSINYQNGQVQQLQTAYNKAADLVNQSYTQKAALTTEQYNFIKDTITEMYNNVAQRGGLLSNMSTQTMDYYNNQAIMLNNVLSQVQRGATPEAQEKILNMIDPKGNLKGLLNIPLTSTGSFTDTQINSGAVNSGKSIGDFKSLNADVQNTYINNPVVATATDSTGKNVDLKFSDYIEQLILNVTDGDMSKEEADQAVDQLSIPDNVKQYVKQLYSNVSPSAQGSANKGGLGKQFWTAFRQTLGF